MKQDTKPREWGLMLTGENIRAMREGWKWQTRRKLGLANCEVLDAAEWSGARKAWGHVRERLSEASYNPDCAMLTVQMDEPSPAPYFYRSLSIAPRYVTGDVIWWKETWRPFSRNGDYEYRADVNPLDDIRPWKSAMFMPKAAGRYRSTIKGTWFERLGDISEADAKAEGSDRADYIICMCGHLDIAGGYGVDDEGDWHCPKCDSTNLVQPTAQWLFRTLWNTTHKDPSAWDRDRDSWVLCVEWSR